ncbi:hypothetical protein [Streptomyces sp. KS 21]|uniref:hypothetical protein n=1 Tax=Streptomyces sp. KS 21 TaxID=2485150 RepID=UPI0010626275|nr:hypothetical protein [Streptomyces sp. KS 21]TDU67042.1 hypothetical protein EDD91_8074 [Streptomyces sp. KS 21]TDU67988.1 hypothetical protein EDD91_8051 [Streptomyces sp. KS 21]
MTRSFAQCRNIIVNVEGVLLKSPQQLSGTLGSLPPRRIFKSGAWLKYLAGTCERREAVQTLGKTLGVGSTTVETAVHDYFEQYRIDSDLLSILDRLTAEGKQIFLICPYPHHEWEQIREKHAPVWEHFNPPVLTAESRKDINETMFFTRLLQDLDIQPADSVYVGADTETLQFARAAGITSVHYRRPLDLHRARRDGAAMLKAADTYVLAALEEGFCQTDLVTPPASGAQYGPIDEIWSTLYALYVSETFGRSAAGARIMQELTTLAVDGLWSFMRSYENFPPDVELPVDADDTALALSVLHKYGQADDAQIKRAAERILANTDASGVIRLYFTPDRPRVDSTVCASALYPVYLAGLHQHHSARKTEDFLFALLEGRGYQAGSAYIPSPEFFLYVLFRLAAKFKPFRDRFGAILADRVTERSGLPAAPAALAQRVIMSRSMGRPCEVDYERLLDAQNPDGSWEPSPCWGLPSAEGDGYNRILDTAFAAEAIRLSLALAPEGDQGERSTSVAAAT